MELRIRDYFWGRGGVRLDGARREPSGVTDKALSLDWPQWWLEGCCLIIQTIQLFCVTFLYLCLINDKGFEAWVPYSSFFSLVLLYGYLGLRKTFYPSKETQTIIPSLSSSIKVFWNNYAMGYVYFSLVIWFCLWLTPLGLFWPQGNISKRPSRNVDPSQEPSSILYTSGDK